MHTFTVLQVNESLPHARDLRWAAAHESLTAEQVKNMHTPVGMVRAKNLDEVFELTNLWENSPLWDADGRKVSKRRDGQPMVSLSVGDVVRKTVFVDDEMHFELWKVASVGFELVG